MNGYMNPIKDSIMTSTAPLNSAYKIFRKQGDLTIIGPVNCWVFIDENPYSINDGMFVCDIAAVRNWVDIPASYHVHGAALAFADGHSEIRIWRDGAIVNFHALTAPPTGFGPQADSGAGDLQWLQQRSTSYVQ